LFPLVHLRTAVAMRFSPIWHVLDCWLSLVLPSECGMLCFFENLNCRKLCSHVIAYRKVDCPR
jgi:hypothetical protein